MKYYLSWSGGKDSTASVILAHENNIPIEFIVISLPYFDKKKGIYADHPLHVEWLFEVAIPTFKNWGYNVVILSSDKDYKYYFYHTRLRSKNPDRIGKIQGWLLGGMCDLNREKVLPIKNFLKSLDNDDCCSIVGIGIEEIDRLERLHNRHNQISLLEQFGYTCEMAKELCKKYGLLSPIYDIGKSRQGCWFCPNQGYRGFASLKKEYPDLWNELKNLNNCSNLVSNGFMYGKTFSEVEQVVDYINSQLSIFDLL